jgi:sugar transferase EpsL
MYPLVKRLIDCVGALAGLLLLSPVMAIVAVAIRCKMGKPVLFRQIRPGFLERPFVCLKFRTMTNECDEEGRLLLDRQRLTRLGLFLRRTSLDELPQLWNVLRGDLSLVGPRPLYTEYLPYYTPEEHLRHSVPPGLTGWAQIHGRNYLSFDERLAMDVWYVRHRNWWLDLRIILKTVYIVLKRRGIANDPRAPHAPLHEQRARLRGDLL